MAIFLIFYLYFRWSSRALKFLSFEISHVTQPEINRDMVYLIILRSNNNEHKAERTESASA